MPTTVLWLPSSDTSLLQPKSKLNLDILGALRLHAVKLNLSRAMRALVSQDHKTVQVGKDLGKWKTVSKAFVKLT